MKFTTKLLDRLMCPLVSALIQIFVIFTIFIQFFEIKDHYYSSISNAKIKKKIENNINRCEKGYWISWIILDGNVSKRKYYFQDVIGYDSNSNIENDHSYSIKNTKLNPFYNEIYHKIDTKTYNFLTNMNTGMVGYYEDLEALKNFKSINEALNASNKKIKSIGLSITKNIKKNIVYVFVMTKTIQNGKCNKSDIINILEDLSVYSKENL